MFEVLTKAAANNSTLQQQSHTNASMQRAGVRVRKNVPADGNCLFQLSFSHCM